MLRCETCLVALQIADREDNNCPTCKDYKGYGCSSIKGQKVLLVGLDDEKEIVTVVEDYGNCELLFSNNVLGRDEDCNYGELPTKEEIILYEKVEGGRK